MRNNLKKARTEQGLSLRDLERLSGVPFGTIGAAERGREISVYTAIKIADALGTTVEELFRCADNGTSVENNIETW